MLLLFGLRTRTIVSDRGKEFVSTAHKPSNRAKNPVQALLDGYHIHHSKTAAYHSQANGATERANQRNVGSGIGIIKRVKPFVPSETLQNLYNSLVLPYFDYCSPLWDNCGSMLKEKLQKLQNWAARIMTGANYDVRSTDLLHAMSWKNLNDRHKMNKSVLMFKIVNNHSAPNLKDKFITRDTNLSNYNLRNADINFQFLNLVLNI